MSDRLPEEITRYRGFISKIVPTVISMGILGMSGFISYQLHEQIFQVVNIGNNLLRKPIPPEWITPETVTLFTALGLTAVGYRLIGRWLSDLEPTLAERLLLRGVLHGRRRGNRRVPRE